MEAIFALLGGSKILTYLIAGAAAAIALLFAVLGIRKGGSDAAKKAQLEAQAKARADALATAQKNAGSSEADVIKRLDKWARD